MRVRELPENEHFPGVLVGATIGSPGAVRLPANRQFINMTRKTVDPKNAQFLIESSNVSTQYLAEILGVTPDAITKLHSAGVIRQNGKARGKYDLFDAVPAYLDHLRANKGSDIDARLKLAQAEKIKNQIDKMKNELVKTSDAAAVFVAASASWRNEAGKLPQRVARRIAKSEDPSEIREILRDALDQVFYRFEKGLNQHLDGATQHGTENQISSKTKGNATLAV